MNKREEIVSWLKEKVATETKTKVENVAENVPFANFGLDSIVIVTMVDDLEHWLNISLDPTIFWEYPTIELLTDWLIVEKLPN